MKLIEMDQKAEFSRLAMIADLMRYEILYNHGGFYYDTNIEPLESLDFLRKYPFIIASESEPSFT